MDNFTLTEALDILQNGAWHSVAYITADRAKKQGGKVIRIKECRVIPKHNLHLLEAKALANSTGQFPSSGGVGVEKIRLSKAQNHHSNATRNLTLRNAQVRKMHIHTLFSLNNIPIL
jgi:hypothetical protein